MAGAYCGRVVSLGAHNVDILGRPVTDIPPGQGRLLLDEIRITAAGTAAGTSVISGRAMKSPPTGAA